MTYKELFEKYAKREQQRCIAGLISGVVSLAVSVWLLKKVQDDKRSASRR